MPIALAALRWCLKQWPAVLAVAALLGAFGAGHHWASLSYEARISALRRSYEVQEWNAASLAQERRLQDAKITASVADSVSGELGRVTARADMLWRLLANKAGTKAGTGQATAAAGNPDGATGSDRTPAQVGVNGDLAIVMRDLIHACARDAVRFKFLQEWVEETSD